ncbi:FadR/GntR family transcriptional regulator [Vibrio hippocampi]|uniref:HTH gntR-type domain-containing protein n=1 Tax=Vibrio hippocampi TaxID=654686 RepID=A0ABN8DMD7_9VIBR|nr:GntR family transcriptional regulator [Vibrio hippocampi]CAH0528719.1 hypothetical protein VHP8226_02745 [Vibrio hippocampi]
MMENGKESIHIKISNEIARKIITGQFTDSVLPTEMELSDYYAVSRNSVREALKILTSKGLLSSKQKSGTKVTPRTEWNFLDPQLFEWFSELPEMSDIIDKFIRIQKVLIPEACADAAKFATSEQRIQLSRIYQSIESQSYTSECALSTHLHCEFYKSLLLASNNELFSPYAKILDIVFATQSQHTSALTQCNLTLFQAIYNSIMIADEKLARVEAEKLFA